MVGLPDDSGPPEPFVGFFGYVAVVRNDDAVVRVDGEFIPWFVVRYALWRERPDCLATVDFHV